MKLTDKQWALLPLRLIIGFGFVAHGYAKLSRGPDKFANILEGIGIPQPHIMAWIITLLEFIGGVGVMSGAFVVPLTLPLTIVMITALITVHFQYGFSSIKLKAMTASGAEFGPIGYEMNLLYIVGLLTLVLIGRPTRLSVDNWLKMRKHSGTDRARL
jgi:putative oxidoreductase